MDQTTAINHSAPRGPGGGPAAQAALAIFAISLATLLGAWFFQFVLGYPPCPLCLQQRIPYYIVIPLAVVIGAGARRGVSPRLAAAGLSVILIAVLCGAALGTYHAGVEWHFGPGRPTAGPARRSQQRRIAARPAQFSPRCALRSSGVAFLGISLAGYNVLISLAMAAITAWGRWRCASSRGERLEHFPEKWPRVFRRKCDQIYSAAPDSRDKTLLCLPALPIRVARGASIN